MIAPPPERDCQRQALPVHSEGPGGAVLTVGAIVPRDLIAGDEIIHFAMKPSPWFVLLVSGKWLCAAVCLCLLACTRFVPFGYTWYLWQLGIWMAVLRVGWALLEWVSRLYVLTDRRVLRVRGVFNIELFECYLSRIENTYLTLSLGERVTLTGTISFQTAGTAALASWQTIARPLDAYERLREAIARAGPRSNNGR